MGIEITSHILAPQPEEVIHRNVDTVYIRNIWIRSPRPTTNWISRVF